VAHSSTSEREERVDMRFDMDFGSHTAAEGRSIAVAAGRCMGMAVEELRMVLA
jgi:hypothetical protein